MSRTKAKGMQRRQFLQVSVAGAVAGALGTAVPSCKHSTSSADRGTHNLLSTYPTLSLKTRDWRWGRIRRMMEAQKVEALIVMPGGQFDDPTSYLTNGGSAVVFFPLNGDPIAFNYMSNAMNVAALLTDEASGIDSWIKDWRFGEGTPEDFVRTLRQKKLAGMRIGTVGVEKTGHFGRRLGKFKPGGLADFIREQLPKTSVVELWEPFAQLWLVKNEEELAMFRKGAAAAEVAAELFLGSCKPGNTLADVMNATTTGLTQYGIDIARPAIGSGSDGGRGISWMRQGMKPPVIKRGDLLTSELFIYVGLLHAQGQVSVSVGEPNEDRRKLAAIARESYEIGVKTLRPGVTFRELAEGMSKPLRREGAWHLTPLLHTLNPLEGVGILMEDMYGKRGFTGLKERLGGMAIPEQPLDGGDLIIEENMTMMFEVNSSFERTYVLLGGNLIVTKNGCEELNSSTSQMMIASA